jgi:glycosyltransferase involved in cell wall biosynthesis
VNKRNIRELLQQSEVCFFEWASDLLASASFLPRQCKIVTRLHSFELYDWAPKINWEAVDKIILVSQTMQSRFCELYPQHAAKSEVVYNGIDLSQYTSPIEKEFSFRIGMLCNILPIKRVYEAVLALAELRNRGYEASLHIAGNPEREPRYTQAVYRLVKELNLSNAVTFYGHTDGAADWLHGIDIFLSHSYWEGQQVALLEALASGCYCLAHFWAGVEEILPQENIFVGESQLISKLIAYATLPDEEKHQLQKQSRAIAEGKFDLEQTKSIIRRILQDLVQ